MKKIILLLFFISLFLINIHLLVNGSSANVEDIYIEIGVGSDDLLLLDGFVIVDNEVNWNFVGHYEVLYYNEFTSKYLKREVVVQDIENLHKTVMKFSNFSEINLESDYSYVDTLYKTSTSYYVLANYQVPNPTYYDQEYGCVFYYENDILKWQYAYNSEFGNVYAGCLTKNSIVICLAIYDSPLSSQTSLMLVELNENKEVIKSKKFIGNGQDHPFRIFFQDNFLYLLMTTTSKTDDYYKYHKASNNVILLLKLDYANLLEIGYVVVGNNSYNYFIDCVFNDNMITLLVHTSGTSGSYNNDKSYEGYLVVRINHLMKITNYFYVGRSYDSMKGLISNGYNIFIYYTNPFESGNHLCLQKLTNEGKSIFRQKLSMVDVNYYISDMKVIYGEEGNIYCFLNAAKNGQYYDGGLLVISNDNLEYLEGDYQQDRLVKVEHYGKEIVKVYYSNNTIKLLNCEILQVSSYYSINDKFKKLIYIVNYNGQVIEAFYNNELDYQRYGYQETLAIYYLSNNKMLILKENINVFSITNIKQNQTYQLGVKLEFNSDGYLGDSLIYDGYAVMAKGTYNLRLRGLGDEETIIQFHVDDLLIKCKYKTNNYPMLEKTEESYNAKTNIPDNIDIDIKNQKAKGGSVIIVLSMLIISLIIVVVIRRKKCRY